MLKLVSVNVEHDRHREPVIDFLSNVQPDIVCFQEISEFELTLLKEKLGGIETLHAPMTVWPDSGEIVGLGVLSRMPITRHTLSYYDAEPERLTVLDQSTPELVKETVRQAFLSAEVSKDGDAMTIATTHFTWTPDGQANDDQRKDLQKLFMLLEPLKEFVLCGDFNAPRGLEIFNTLAARYTDNIPSKYQTSLDASLHRVGEKKFKESGMDRFMVDGLFTTPAYVASNVRLEFGISDHAAVIADIKKRIVSATVY